jgi:hypothetical protein
MLTSVSGANACQIGDKIASSKRRNNKGGLMYEAGDNVNIGGLVDNSSSSSNGISFEYIA